MHKKQNKVLIVLAANTDLKHVAVVIMELTAHVTLLAMEHITPPDHFALLAYDSSLALI